MKGSPTRLGLYFALTLLLPCLFAGVWLWLVPGGVVARAAAGERQAAERLLAGAAEDFADALARSAAESPLQLRLDERRHVVAPFGASHVTEPAREPGIAERTALARLQSGNREEARTFFRYAAEHDGLGPEGWLAYAEATSHEDVAAARALLDTARERHAATRVGPMSFSLAALLLEARWRGGGRDDRLHASFFELVQDVPADAVPAVLDDLQASPRALDADRAAALRAAAAAARQFATRALPMEVRTLDAAVVVPTAADRVAAVPTRAAEALREAAFARVAERDPTLQLVVADADGVHPHQHIRALSETWLATPVPGVLPTSALLSRTAAISLVLALVTLVLGNLLLWRTTRRESQLVRLRADFVDVVSHELRTPLTALSLKAEMLAAGDVPEHRREHYLHGLHHDVLRLTDQVERILDFGRLQKGGQLRREPVAGRALLAKGLREGRPALRLVAQQLEVEVPRQLPSVVGDVDVLGRALRNLLENAAKYAPEGSTVGVRAFASGRELVVEVLDRGPGVPQRDRRSIFQPFVRGSEALSGTPGSGLGLALVSAAAESHGGRVTVAERPGGGAVFTLHLPIDGDGELRA